MKMAGLDNFVIIGVNEVWNDVLISRPVKFARLDYKLYKEDSGSLFLQPQLAFLEINHENGPLISKS